MKKLINFIVICSSFACLLGCYGQTAIAAETSSNEKAGFYYEIVKPENQIVKEAGYFDLRMAPNQEQTVHINLVNTGETDITLQIELNGAKTNQNGVIEYGRTVLENDSSLKYDFVDVVKAPTEIIIPKQETVPLELQIRMPEEEFDGTIAGGIRMQIQDKEEKVQAGVTHKIAYMIGMLLRETDTPIEPDLQLNGVYPQLDNYRGAIYVDFSNVTATFLGGVTVETTIAAKQAPDDILYDSKTSGMSMAPNSFQTYPVSLNGNPYVAGDYIADIFVNSGDKEWKWTEEFTIDEKKAAELNEQDVNIVQKRGFNWVWIGIITVGVLIVIGISIFILRWNKNKKKRTRSKL